ncbi:MAG: hypothetical protein VX278_16700, partial [Myxococcota bacterium]|nr:hypothetical protein [Myxococcota bacterium]
NNETLSCTVNGNTFLCDPLQNSIEVSSFGVDLDLEFLLSGTMQSDEEITLNLEADLNSCSGSGCTIVSFLVSFPCSMTLEAPSYYQ